MSNYSIESSLVSAGALDANALITSLQSHLPVAYGAVSSSDLVNVTSTSPTLYDSCAVSVQPDELVVGVYTFNFAAGQGSAAGYLWGTVDIGGVAPNHSLALYAAQLGNCVGSCATLVAARSGIAAGTINVSGKLWLDNVANYVGISRRTMHVFRFKLRA